MKTLELVVDLLNEWGFGSKLYQYDNSKPYVRVSSCDVDFCDILSVDDDGQYAADGSQLAIFMTGQGTPIDIINLAHPDSIESFEVAVRRAYRLVKAPNRYSSGATGVQGCVGVTGATGPQGLPGANYQKPVKEKSQLPNNASDGDTVMVTDEGTLYTFIKGNWLELTQASQISGGSKPSPLDASSLLVPTNHRVSGKTLRAALVAKGKGFPSRPSLAKLPN